MAAKRSWIAISPKKPALKKSKPDQAYLHGYSREEQDRLYRQAKFLEPMVFQEIDFDKQTEILEVGSGVGAQTEILLRRFPHLRITGLDASPTQLARARKQLGKALSLKKLNLVQADAAKMPFEESCFDGAFLCWILEHVENPLKILKEVRRVLKRGGVIYCTEVLNASFYLHPYSPATLQYWFAFNDHQWNLKGDPFVGGKLANHLLAAGFQNVTCRPVFWHLDNRAPKTRIDGIDYTTELLMSGAPALLQAGRVTPELVATMKKELASLRNDPDAVLFYAFIQARAEAL